ncbi:MAG: TIGR02677 family protein [bacterium]
MEEKLRKPIPEASYLTAANADRYRSILRYFYQQHERLRYYLFPEEVFAHLKQDPYFAGYSEEQLQQDLNQLVEWKNLIPRQDTGKVSTIEEFKKKRFRYQCTPYTVEIERMVQRLEQMGDSFGGSLEGTLFDRLLNLLQGFISALERKGTSGEDLHALWEEVHETFRKLTKNATDYLAYLQSEKVEEMMQAEAFLAYKEAITQYLRSFMTALQRTSLRIEAVLKDTREEERQKMAGLLAEYYLGIPRLDERPPRERVAARYYRQWEDMASWFLGQGGRESDLVYLQRVTGDTIRRITRYAQRLGERHHNFKSRRKDYLHLATWFSSIADLEEAHKLSACVFGVLETRHLYAGPMPTEDIYADVWDVEPTELTINPRIRNYRPKTRPNAVVSHREEKEAIRQRYLEERQAEQKLLQGLKRQNRIVLGELPVVEARVRKILLGWIERCMASSDGVAKIETGHRVKLEKKDSNKVVLRCEDGLLILPNYVLHFLDVG